MWVCAYGPVLFVSLIWCQISCSEPNAVQLADRNRSSKLPETRFIFYFLFFYFFFVLVTGDWSGNKVIDVGNRRLMQRTGVIIDTKASEMKRRNDVDSNRNSGERSVQSPVSFIIHSLLLATTSSTPILFDSIWFFFTKFFSTVRRERSRWNRSAPLFNRQWITPAGFAGRLTSFQLHFEDTNKNMNASDSVIRLIISSYLFYFFKFYGE